MSIEKKTAEFERMAMARSREQYKDGVENIINGAAVEWFKCRIDDKLVASGQVQRHPDRNHWELKWRFHLAPKLRTAMTRSITFTDRDKAVFEVLADVEQNVKTFVSVASNTMARYLNQSPIKMNKVLDEIDTADFLRGVKNSIEDHLSFMKA